MYKHKNAPEPTCEGWWWSGGQVAPRYCWKSDDAWVCSTRGRIQAWGYCMSLSDNWTGPIPKPEDKPASMRAHCPDVVERENKRARKFCEAMDKSAPSKDEGKKWGELLHGIRLEEMAKAAEKIPGAAAPLACYTECLPGPRHMYDRIALRFRAECVKPHARFVAAACALRALYAEDTINLDDQEGWKKEFDTAYDALPVPAPSAPDEPPKPTPQGVCPVCGHQDIGNASFEDYDTEEDVEPPKHDLRATDEELARASWEVHSAQNPPRSFKGIGAVIRVKLEGEAPGVTVSDDILEGIAIEHLVTHRVIDESLVKTCAGMVRAIRAKLEGKS